MKTWMRNPVEQAICGGICHHPMRKGAPMLEFRFQRASGGADIKLNRCEACAGEPVPADLPPLREPQPIVPMAHIRTGANALPFDYKMASAGREPGEDDE